MNFSNRKLVFKKCMESIWKEGENYNCIFGRPDFQMKTEKVQVQRPISDFLDSMFFSSHQSCVHAIKWGIFLNPAFIRSHLCPRPPLSLYVAAPHPSPFRRESSPPLLSCDLKVLRQNVTTPLPACCGLLFPSQSLTVLPNCVSGYSSLLESILFPFSF